MSINFKQINSFQINATSFVDGTFSGSVFSVSQKILVKYTGAVLGVTQTISYLASGTQRSIVSFDQKILAKQSSTPIYDITQYISAPSPSFFVKNGWDIYLYINNKLIDRSIIGGKLTISRKENGASSLSFTLIPAWGTQNPEQYVGQTVFVNILKIIGGNTILQRAFTGWVDTPKIDLIERKITYECSDRRKQQIMQLPYQDILNIGYYSRYVFGDPQDQEDELTKRLETVPYTFDFDQWGNYTVTPWYNPSQTNWTYANSDVYYENPYPMVEYQSRQSKVNTIQTNVSYTYKRLIQQVATVTWAGYSDFISDWHNQGTPTFPTKTMVTSAANSASWFLVRPINLVNLWPAGTYNGVVWQPNQVTNTYVPQTTDVIVPYYATPTSLPSNIWPDGKAHTITQTLLIDNQPVMLLQSSVTVDTSSNLCRGASWFAAKHIVQSITEFYPIEITSPSGIAAYGRVLKQENCIINDSYDSSGWLGEKTINTINSPLPTATNLLTDAAGYGKGSQFITCESGGSGALYFGNLITFSNDPSGMTYMVLNNIPNVSAGCVIEIASPGLSGIIPAISGTVVIVPNLGASTGFYNYNTKRADLHTALETTINRAYTTLQSSYRDVTVRFKRFISPELDLSHYIHLNTSRINAHGKVANLEHVINIETGEATTEVQLLLSRPPGNDSTNYPHINTPPYEDVGYILNNTITVTLGTHVGQNPDTTLNPSAVTWNGYIGNSNLNAGLVTQAPKRTNYQESFVVDYPALPVDMTDPRTVTQQTPGTATGVQTDNASYLLGANNVTIASGGSGFINAGDTFTFVGDITLTIYTASNDITNVASGGTLSFSPGLAQALGASNYPLTFFSNPNNGVCGIPQDSLTETFL